MRTKNGAVIKVEPLNEQSSFKFIYPISGEGYVEGSLSAEDALSIVRETFAKYDMYSKSFKNDILQSCLRIVMNNGYTVRKAGC